MLNRRNTIHINTLKARCTFVQHNLYMESLKILSLAYIYIGMQRVKDTNILSCSRLFYMMRQLIKIYSVLFFFTFAFSGWCVVFGFSIYLFFFFPLMHICVMCILQINGDRNVLDGANRLFQLFYWYGNKTVFM